MFNKFKYRYNFEKVAINARFKTYSQVTIKMVSEIKNLRTSPTGQSKKIKQVSLKKKIKTKAPASKFRGCTKLKRDISILHQVKRAHLI